MATPESIVRDSICEYLQLHKCFYFIHDSVGIFDPVKQRFRSNTNKHRMKGVADILGIWQGKPLAIEVKSARERLTPEQRLFLERFRAEGGISILARSIDDVEKALKLTNINNCLAAKTAIPF